MPVTATKPGRSAARIAALGALAVIAALGTSRASEAQTLDRVRGAAAIRLGYEANARPFSFGDGGAPTGYAVALCKMVADRVKADLGLPDLAASWVPVQGDDRFRGVRDGSVDLLCSAPAVTLSSRKEVSFSLPIFPSGTGAVLSASSPVALREVLTQGQPSGRPIWRGSPARVVLEQETFSPVAGTVSEDWVAERIKALELAATVVPVKTYEDGIQRILEGSSGVLFGDMPLLRDAVAHSPASGNLIILDRYFTHQSLALALPRADEDFRLEVDRALSGIYGTDGFRNLLAEWFGTPDEKILTFFRQTALPE